MGKISLIMSLWNLLHSFKSEGMHATGFPTLTIDQVIMELYIIQSEKGSRVFSKFYG